VVGLFSGHCTSIHQIAVCFGVESTRSVIVATLCLPLWCSSLLPLEPVLPSYVVDHLSGRVYHCIRICPADNFQLLNVYIYKFLCALTIDDSKTNRQIDINTLAGRQSERYTIVPETANAM